MSVKGSKMIRFWVKGMHERYDGGWTTHSNAVITRVAQKLTREPGEMLIMERDAFSPGSWTEGDTKSLWMTHDDTPANLANFTTGDTLPTFKEEEFDQWEADDEERPDWARDWSWTYMLHAFWPHDPPSEDKYPDVNPRYVLERRSNFARAVYPIAKDMYDSGLIEIEDSHRSERNIEK